MPESVAYAIGPELGFDELVGALRAVAEPTRLRLVALLGHEELTVTEISRVIGQSQPRTSRHLRLLVDAGILERAPEGAFVYYRLAEDSPAAELALRRRVALPPPTDTMIAADLAALARVRQARIEAATAYRNAHADELEALQRPVRRRGGGRARAARHARRRGPDRPAARHRHRHRPDPRAARAAQRAAASASISTTTCCSSRVPRSARPSSPVPRSATATCTARRSRPASFDVAVMHHVLHLLDDPGGAIVDAARLLRPGGRLLVADFASHDLEQLRELHGHRQLGIADTEMLRLGAGRRARGRERALAAAARTRTSS